MRKDFSHLDEFRVNHGKYISYPGDRFGAFKIRRNDLVYTIIAADGSPESGGWEHASVHLRHKRNLEIPLKRTPTWEEMCYVKHLFWDPEEPVIQFHPPQSSYVNIHPYVLHLWYHPNQLTPPIALV